ncbi:MCE family protein [Kutzneria albida]|uniref:MCE family protein n=1 Tax=Kutzneria albida DSM 43870 TaxID=1449976 RepID=W5WSC8_9PSEU|nr:MlaD family protein [Kutzneria albida]AHI01070.1 hypothetical protein KALB_7712 [Kutzneria albida DSM 43870]
MTLYRFTVLGVVLSLLTSTAYLVLRPQPANTAALHFERAVNLHPGDDVRVLGVRIGQVTSVRPEGRQVRVDVSYDARQRIPAQAKAVIVAPSLISGRFVQFAPAYTGGPALADGAEVPTARTVVPIEWDQVERELTGLAQALGPTGANQDGALSHAVDTAAANLSGQGGTLRKTITDLSAAAATLSAGGKDLFGTVRNLNSFVGALNASNQQVRSFATQVAAISRLLDENKAQIAAAIKAVDTAMAAITQFLHDNHDRISTTVRSLGQVTQVLAEDREQLAAILHSAPTALADTYNTYDPELKAFAARLALNQTQDLAGFTCTLVFSLGGTPEQCRSALDPLLRLLNTPTVPVAANPLAKPAQDLTGLLLGGAR